MAASSKEDCLHRARSLLVNINGRKLKGNTLQGSEQAAETLGCTIDLLQNLQSLLVTETIPLDPASSDWKVLKALLELLVRLGISPHLNPGVGILRDKLQDDCSNISIQLSGLSVSNSLSQSTALARLAGMPLLFLCAEALNSFIWTRSSPHVTPSPSIATSQSEKTGEADTKTRDTTRLKLEDTFLGDFGTYGSPIGNNPVVQMTASSPVRATWSLIGTNLHDGTQLLPIPSTSHLVMKCFLWDLMAAYLQLGFGPCETNEDTRHQARARLKLMVEQFPAEQMVVASFVLLNLGSPTPPPWIKAELGKQLSKLVMRGEGLVTVLKELVGQVTKGNVESYEKVAGHLAKVPKSVATADEYLKALCPQLLPLLLLKHKPKDSVVGEISLAASNNVFHTSVSLACKIFSMEPTLASNHMVRPIMRPLLALKSMQKSMDMVGSVSSKVAKGDQHKQVTVMENEVVDSLVQISVLLTAGSSAARELILLEARVVVPLLLRLHCNLAAINHPNPTINTKKFASPDQRSRAFEGRGGVVKAFLPKGLSLSASSEQAYEEDSNLSKLKSSLADVVMAGIDQPVEHALHCIWLFMLEQTMNVLRWPQEEGEVWEALQSEGSQSRSKTTYLSQLLLMVENWPLVLALMEKLLHKILNLRRSLLKGEGGFGAVELLGYMQDFEELNNDTGAKALEYDTCGAASLVKALLEDELVVHDEDILELVLHMVFSVMKGIKAAAAADGSQKSHVHGLVLNDLLLALQRIYANSSVGNKLRQMAFTLAEEVSPFRKTG